jgi:hypothetical protein
MRERRGPVAVLETRAQAVFREQPSPRSGPTAGERLGEMEAGGDAVIGLLG